MPTTEYWPHNFNEMKQNRKGQTTYTFEPVEVTIKRVFAPKMDGSKMQFSTGWSFEEDETPSGEYTGVIWSHPGVWKDNNFISAYAGPTGEQGQRARVTLGITEGDGRNFYNLHAINLLGATESNGSGPEVANQQHTSRAAAPGGTGAGTGGSDTIQARVSRGQAINLRAEMFGSLVQATDKRLKELGVTVEQLQVQLGTLNNVISILDAGRQPTIEELDGIPEEAEEEPEDSALIRAAMAMGAQVVPSDEPPAEDVEELTY